MASRKSPKRTAKPALGGAVTRGIAAVRPSVGKGSKSGPGRAATAKVAARRAPPSRRSAPPSVRPGTELAVTPPSSRRPTERETLARRCEELEAKVAELDALHARSERTVKALRDVGLALGSTLDLDQLLELILGKIAELLEADRATLYLLDEQRQRLLSRIIIGDEAKSIELPVGNGIAGNVAKFGQTIRIKDAYRDRRFSRQWDDITGYRTRSILAAPMKNHVGRTIGVIQVLNKRLGVAGGDEFSQHDEELLTALATQAAVSIDNSRLFLSVIQKNMQLVETKEQLEHRVADLKLLFDLESAMAHAATFEDLARAVVTEAARACGAQAGGLLADEGEDGTFLYFLDLAKSDVGVRRVGMRRGEGIVGLAMVRNEAQHLPPAELKRGSDHPPVSSRLGALLGVEVKSAVAMPLEGPDEQPIGALGLYNATRPGGFSQDARALLRLISANASTAVRLYLSRAEREKSRRLSSIGRLFSGVIHDLRTPMTVINGYVQLMAKTDDPSMRAEQARLVMQQFDTISSMQREVLEFARGERSVLVRKVFLEKFFGDIEEQIQREIAGMKIDLVVDLRDRGAARFDEVKIQRLVWNLARNAIEAMHGGGTLTIGVSRDRDDLVLRVSDTGTGIPEDVRRRMFGSFVTSGKRGGTGLGLSLVKKIVEEHHGSVSYETGPTGTTFTVRLPQTEHEGRTVLEAN
ncbi:MAG TPA: GAF domain-containing protein, partial [Polyangiaceae bacterium]|nr:GAF domain-containing protein [Polyangiaceae bacterium]